MTSSLDGHRGIEATEAVSAESGAMQYTNTDVFGYGSNVRPDSRRHAEAHAARGLPVKASPGKPERCVYRITID